MGRWGGVKKGVTLDPDVLYVNCQSGGSQSFTPECWSWREPDSSREATAPVSRSSRYARWRYHDDFTKVNAQFLTLLSVLSEAALVGIGLQIKAARSTFLCA